MQSPTHLNSTVEQIRDRFDNDFRRFSKLDTGQSATIGAPLAMELITQAATQGTARQMETAIP